jgi:hypothetical protein
MKILQNPGDVQHKVVIGGSNTSAFQPFHKSRKIDVICEESEQDLEDPPPITLKEIIKHKHKAFRELKTLFNSKTKIKCWPC